MPTATFVKNGQTYKQTDIHDNEQADKQTDKRTDRQCLQIINKDNPKETKDATFSYKDDKCDD